MLPLTACLTLTLQVLLRLLKAKAAADHLAVLVGMDLSLHSLEVVNRLTTAAQLPQEFVHDYIVGCIASCERAQVRSPEPWINI